MLPGPGDGPRVGARAPGVPRGARVRLRNGLGTWLGGVGPPPRPDDDGVHPTWFQSSGASGIHVLDDRLRPAGDDLFTNGRYPNIDLEAGGSVEAWIATLDRALALDFDRVIPGHGALSDREGLERFQVFLRDVWEIAKQAVAEQLSLERTQELARRTLTSDAGFETLGIPGVFRLDRDFVIRRAYEEATAAARPHQAVREVGSAAP